MSDRDHRGRECFRIDWREIEALNVLPGEMYIPIKYGGGEHHIEVNDFAYYFSLNAAGSNLSIVPEVTDAFVN